MSDTTPPPDAPTPPEVLVPDPPAVLTPACVVCGWPVLPGATCTVDGTVAPAEVKS